MNHTPKWHLDRERELNKLKEKRKKRKKEAITLLYIDMAKSRY